MKTIGLIGGITWLSTLEYYRQLNQLVNERVGGVASAQVILYSVNFADIKKWTEADRWDLLEEMIAGAATKLEQAGADCILIGANTMHKIAGGVQDAIKIPLIHVAEETARAIVRNHQSTVALLGTKYTMQLPFYREILSSHGIQAILPAEDDINYINTAIYNEMGKGLFLPETKQRMLRIIDDLREKGAQGVILGCTELPILIQPGDCDIKLYDTTAIHARAAVHFALTDV